MTEHYVRAEMLPPQPAPTRTGGIVAWLHKRLFSTVSDTVMTIIGILFLIWAVPPVYDFLIGSAVLPGGTVEDCRAMSGACWAFISARISFFIYGFYPLDELWRPNVVFLLTAVLLIPLLWPRLPFKRANAFLFFIVLPIVSYFLLVGGSFGLKPVPTEFWGGLLLTLIISLIGIICSIPIGILLALGRQSKLPIVKTLCVMYIELWRAVPLITVLFMASIMLPLFMPQGVVVDKLIRALVAVTLFESAYLAEVIRGGLQALPRGQYEAADSLALNYWKRTRLIILPQALTHVIPGIVNTFIALFKDTTLVSIVGLFELLGTVKAATGDIAWSSPTQAVTGYIFAGMIFWIFCFSISRYSMFMERRLDTGHKR
jgi:general L-amino acid transport system permease protein